MHEVEITVVYRATSNFGIELTKDDVEEIKRRIHRRSHGYTDLSYTIVGISVND